MFFWVILLPSILKFQSVRGLVTIFLNIVTDSCIMAVNTIDYDVNTMCLFIGYWPYSVHVSKICNAKSIINKIQIKFEILHLNTFELFITTPKIMLNKHKTIEYFIVL